MKIEISDEEIDFLNLDQAEEMLEDLDKMKRLIKNHIEYLQSTFASEFLDLVCFSNFEVLCYNKIRFLINSDFEILFKKFHIHEDYNLGDFFISFEKEYIEAFFKTPNLLKDFLNKNKKRFSVSKEFEEYIILKRLADDNFLNQNQKQMDDRVEEIKSQRKVEDEIFKINN